MHLTGRTGKAYEQNLYFNKKCLTAVHSERIMYSARAMYGITMPKNRKIKSTGRKAMEPYGMTSCARYRHYL